MKLSVIIPTCDRAKRLLECLHRIKGADEIVVSDDGSTTETREMIQRDFRNVIWVQGRRRGPAANRNHGALKANGEWIVFVDDDCLPTERWIQEIRKAAVAADAVEGKTIAPDRTNHPLEDVVENLSGDLFWSCNLAVRRSLFEELGGFDEDFQIAGGEDLEFASRLRECTRKLVFAPEAIVYHPVRRLTWVGLVNKVFQMHWHILYRLKVDADRCATLYEVLDLIRNTVRQILSPSAKRSVQGSVTLFLEWLLLPAWIFYLAVWERRFRRNGLALKSRVRSEGQIRQSDVAAPFWDRTLDQYETQHRTRNPQ